MVRRGYATIYDEAGNPIEIEARCAICLRGVCFGTKVVRLKNRPKMWGVFVPMCKFCRLDIEKGRNLTVRHDRRQIDQIENGDYQGFEFEDDRYKYGER